MPGWKLAIKVSWRLYKLKLNKSFSATKDCDVDTSQTYAAAFTDKDALAGVLGALKGIPDASLEWVGDKITLKAGDAAALEALTAKVKAPCSTYQS